MSDQGISRFTPQNKTTHERLSTNTVGLVALSDFRKRRAEVLEQQEREAREAAISGTSTPDRSLTGTPDNAGSESNSGPGARVRPPKKKQKQGKKLLSFDDEEHGDSEPSSNPDSKREAKDADPDPDSETGKPKFKANVSVGIVPKAVTKSALRKEASQREALRREFVAVQEAVKATEIAVPFVFYDGSNIPGGTVRMKKGDFVWVFLDKSRKVGAELGVGGRSNARRGWARVGVDDLMLVRDTVIIPHHYDFHFFVMNKTVGPSGRRLFDYSSEAPVVEEPAEDNSGLSTENHLSTSASRAAAARSLASIDTLEGASEDPTLTKVVDRRWYERNKHIYPASTWQAFDPEKDYAGEIRKDTGGNTYFFSK
ncbi:XAP5 domain containing protein [Metarhizium album ARSEF 1941]|uniref:XAP5 domain containing protein n=1 Tax=Metarhizium album (strain ARSEF 1941) TaxID=1081103 RepID=A0A0B2X124_METAS|nr:XAP5 domain containing protein [Metarhizium album ARSEF 1941]KHN99357.1 XAP5 domain containing protein [Metarhizium album ARSEF 1941]